MPLKPGRVNFLVVSDGAVLDGQHEDDAGLLPNFANDAIVPNTVTPAQIHASNSCLKFMPQTGLVLSGNVVRKVPDPSDA
jgi:hypothetical protein